MGVKRASVRAVMISAILAGSCVRLACAAEPDQSPAPLDRYGGGRHYQTGPADPSGPRLSWAGKVERATITPPAAASPAALETSAPDFGASTARSDVAARNRIWAKSADDPSAGPASRLYSVHREFGLTPDPIPAAPLTFTGGGADLAADDAAAAAPQPNRNTAAGRIAITQDRINDSGDVQP